MAFSTRGLSLEFKTQDCRSYRSKENVVEVAERLAALGEITLAEPRLHERADGTLVRVPYSGSASELVDKVYEVKEVDDDEDDLRFVYGPEGATLAVILDEDTLSGKPPASGPTSVSIRFQMHTRRYAEVTGACLLQILEVDVVEEVVRQLSRILKLTYQELSPSYGFFDLLPTFTRYKGKPILERRLQAIYWANLFGPPYAEKFGKEFLMHAPAWKKEELPDGGVFLQLGQNFTDPESGPRQEEVLKYFADLGVKYVTWPHDGLLRHGD